MPSSGVLPICGPICEDVRVAPEAAVDRVAEGEDALARCEWAVAKSHFDAALADAPADPRALDGLSSAVFWLGDMEAPRRLRERAYVEHRRRGDARRAAAAAIFVSSEYRIAGDNQAAARGWLARAERCLEAVGASPERGWIEIERAKSAADLETASEHAQRALAVAREFGDANLEITALAQIGVKLVAKGRWEEGMALLDESIAAAMGGEASDALAICDTCCQTLVACEQIADLRRASEWCRVVVDFTERRNFTPVYAWCRAIYAGVLISSGQWERGERELVRSLRTYETVGGIGSRIVALARLADLRLRQGRPEEAERLLGGCEEHPLALVPLARLRLLRGEAATAAALLERRLDALPGDAPASAPLLPLLVEVCLAGGDHDGAAAAVRRLEELADRLRRENLAALADVAAADVQLARGEHGAVSRLETALETFMAARRADEAAALLRSLGASGRARAAPEGELTARERDVLALLGEGLSNAEIARRLVISEKTAGHHVSRVYRKLRLRNRGEAAAYAIREAAGPLRLP